MYGIGLPYHVLNQQLHRVCNHGISSKQDYHTWPKSNLQQWLRTCVITLWNVILRSQCMLFDLCLILIINLDKNDFCHLWICRTARCATTAWCATTTAMPVHVHIKLGRIQKSPPKDALCESGPPFQTQMLQIHYFGEFIVCIGQIRQHITLK